MNRLTRALLLATAMAVASAGTAPAQTLRQAVEAAWAINPQIASLQAQRNAIAARRVTTQYWFAGPPFVILGHVTDQFITRQRQNNTDGELGVPLWLPGQRAATDQVIDADLLRNDAQIAEAQLAVAGNVREALYAQALAEGEVKIADQRVETARELEADVARRVAAGESAPLEHDLVLAELRDAETAARARRADLATAQIGLRALTGLSVPATSVSEPLAAAPPLDAHPRLQAAARSIAAATAALRLTVITNRDNPDIGVLGSVSRDFRETQYDKLIGLRLRIPFATEARNAPRRAAAQADVMAAQADYAGARRQIEAAVADARQLLTAAQQLAPIVEARLQAIRRAVARLRQSYNAGEIGLTELLRARSGLYDAEAASLLNRLGVARARSRVNQAFGLVP